MRVTSTASITLQYNTTVRELSKALAGVPASAKVSIESSRYYDQRDPGYTKLKFTWTEER